MTNENENEDEEKTPRRRRGADAGQDEVAERLHEEQAQGYSGVAPDPTPNEAYTLKGVSEGQTTPETDKGIGRTVQT